MALIETNFIRPQEVYDRNTGESKVRYRSYDGNNRFIPVVEGEKGVPKTMVEVTHAELKAMRDGGKLTAGALYRITDYNCTTTQENTRSAGHQFDIVLLALSESKLAEEGWAMMHDNIYDVTFADGVTKKCWIYKTPDFDNIVDINTLLGTQDILLSEDASINEETKTIIITNEQYASSCLSVEGLPYNYFQNSNLSAWKVWYCLDNDKSRFAWADDSVDEDSPASITLTFGEDIYYRDESKDKTITFPQTFSIYGWTDDNDNTIYTASTTPNVGNKVLKASGAVQAGVSIASYTPPTQGTGLPNGRGVIYRLIDEWNNDVGYDFKNVQFVRPMTDGEYDADTGTDTWVFTFSVYDVESQEYVDASIISGSRDENYMNYCWNNIISAFVSNQDNTGIFLPNNVFCQQMSLGDDVFVAIGDCYADGKSANNTIASSTMGIVLRRCDSNVISASSGSTIVDCYQRVIFDKSSTIILNGKAVLVET